MTATGSTQAREVFAAHRAVVDGGAARCSGRHTARCAWPCADVRPVLRELLLDEDFTFE